MTPSLPLLLAAGLNELISILVGLVVLVFWVINQLHDAKQRQLAEEASAAPDAASPRPNRPLEQQPEPVREAPDPLRMQIDEFLRRAGQPPPPAPASAPPPPAPREEIVVLLEEPTAKPPRKSLADSLRSKADAAAPARSKPEKTSPRPRPEKRRPQPDNAPRGKSIAQYVADRAGAVTQEFQAEVADLGEHVKQADEQFDRQLQHRFDHRLGSLDEQSPRGVSEQSKVAAADSPAGQIAAMLARPEGVRQAILMNEILRRPVDRW